MRVLGSAVVRNEADLIEAFVRHNLTLLDGLVVVDHLSLDGTYEILQAMVAEGLPLFVARETSATFDEFTFSNRLVRHVFATSDADWVFPLDADEFLRAPSRPELERLLQEHGALAAVTIDWQTYVPAEFTDDVVATLRLAQRVRDERTGLDKVAVSRAFSQNDTVIAAGHHQILRGHASHRQPLHPAPPRLPGVALAHVPIRSARQFTTKIAVGWLASLNARDRKEGETFHWRDAFAYLRSGRPLTPQQLRAFAVNYSVATDRWLPLDAVELVADPFLAQFALRHAHRGIYDPLALVLT
jgi:hypothetical protein